MKAIVIDELEKAIAALKQLEKVACDNGSSALGYEAYRMRCKLEPVLARLRPKQ